MSGFPGGAAGVCAKAKVALASVSATRAGISVQLPLPAEAPRNWLVPAESTDGKLQAGPRFPVAGREITVADVLAWRGPDEAVAGTYEGLFAVKRTK